VPGTSRKTLFKRCTASGIRMTGSICHSFRFRAAAEQWLCLSPDHYWARVLTPEPLRRPENDTSARQGRFALIEDYIRPTMQASLRPRRRTDAMLAVMVSRFFDKRQRLPDPNPTERRLRIFLALMSEHHRGAIAITGQPWASAGDPRLANVRLLCESRSSAG
jgi:hypothetical protein